LFVCSTINLLRLLPHPLSSEIYIDRVGREEGCGEGAEPTTLKLVPIPVWVEGYKYYCKCEKCSKTVHTKKGKQYIIAQLTW
jgi:hypothetical protein